MYKLLIVEDEKTIAQGIANSIPWKEWGFGIAGICYNGLEAVAFIEKEKPDLVLSDIRMPKMDGIALMQHLNKNYPEIKIVILSGYNDFEYLQMSIRNHVAEYLLKPTDVDEFEELFRRMKQDLDKEAGERRAREELLLDRKCNNLLRGYGYDEEQVEQEFYLHDTDRFGVILFRIDNGCHDDKSLFFRQKQDVVKELNRIAQEHGAAVHFQCNYEEEITGIVCFDEETAGIRCLEEKTTGSQSLEEKATGSQSLEEKATGSQSLEEKATGSQSLEEKATGSQSLGEEQGEEPGFDVKKLMEEVLEATGFTLSCGISSFYEDYRMLPQCYEQTKCSVSQNIFGEGDSRIFFFHEIKEANFDCYRIAFDEEQLLKDILNQEEEALEREIAGTFDEFRNQLVKDYNYVNRLTMEVLFNISRKMLKYGVRPEKIMNDNGYGYMDVFDKPNLEEKQLFLSGIFRLFLAECKEQQGRYSKTSELARLIRGIVDKEYMSNLISLEYIADKVHKNTAYISKIFKNEFDCNFSTYVTEKRLEKSRELLADPILKIYEISQQLGWADVSNFIKVFKKKYGMSPDEYRKLVVK